MSEWWMIRGAWWLLRQAHHPLSLVRATSRTGSLRGVAVLFGVGEQ